MVRLMDQNQEETETQKLTRILSKLQELYHFKREQLEKLKDEIEKLHELITELNSIISTQSFMTADQMFSKLLNESKISQKDYFNENVSVDNLQGTSIKRKIFSKEKGSEEKLLCILNFNDFKDIEIKFLHPEKQKIKEISEDFRNIFLKGALIKIKEENPNLKVNYDYYKDTDFIEYIKIFNVNSIKEYDLITEKVQELLASEK